MSVAWALADDETKAVIYDCHLEAIDYVLSYAEREVFHSRSGKNGIVEEDVTGVVAAAFTHFTSRADDPQLHDHVVVWNRAKSVTDGKWRTLDWKAIFKQTTTLSELHQGVLSDLLTARSASAGRPAGAGTRPNPATRSPASPRRSWPSSHAGPSRSPSTVRGPPSRVRRRPRAQRHRRRGHAAAPGGDDRHPARQDQAQPRRPDRTVAGPSRRTRRRGRAARLGVEPEEPQRPAAAALATTSAIRSSPTPPRRSIATVAERHSTYGRHNLLAEAHRVLHGVRFASPDDRVAVAEQITELAVARSVLLTPPELHHTPERYLRPDGSSRLRPRTHVVYTTAAILEAEARLLEAAREAGGPRVSVASWRRSRGEPARAATTG